jgi:hypothetical protein
MKSPRCAIFDFFISWQILSAFQTFALSEEVKKLKIEMTAIDLHFASLHWHHETAFI